MIANTPIRFRVAILALGLFTQLSCAQTGPAADSDSSPGADTASSSPPAPPRDIADALIPSMERPFTEQTSSREPRFDVTVDRAPARQFFMSLVEDTPYSLTLAPGVAGEVSLSLRDVTVEEVLDTVQQAYGFGYERTRTGFLVLPTGLRTKVFHLDYLNLERSGSSEMRVSSGEISSQSSGTNQVANGGNPGVQSGQGQQGGMLTGSRIQTKSENYLWEEVVNSIESIIGAGSGRSVVASPNAGLLVVRGLPDELSKVAEYLRSAELRLNRVVILEAKILEVGLNDGFQSGINWALLATHNGDKGLVSQSGGGSIFDTGFSDGRGNDQDVGPPLSDILASGAGSLFGGVFSLAIQADKFSAFIELLETQGNVRTLSNPRISTVNNQKAVIKVGNDESFVTDISTTTVTGTATTSSPNITLTPFFSGIALDVTPQISDNDEVVLHVHPAVTEVVDQTKSITVSSELIELPLAYSSIRESDSIVRARSGQVVVIGGLIQNDSRDTTYGVPWISRIPYLGRLFEHSQIGNRRNELVILLRPVVVNNDTWDQELRSTSKHIDDAWRSHNDGGDAELSLDGWLPPMPPVSQ